MSAAPINAEDADNFEDIEKQFAVKGRCILATGKLKLITENMSQSCSI